MFIEDNYYVVHIVFIEDEKTCILGKLKGVT